jgi:hypothetical protein
MLLVIWSFKTPYTIAAATQARRNKYSLQRVAWVLLRFRSTMARQRKMNDPMVMRVAKPTGVWISQFIQM